MKQAKLNQVQVRSLQPDVDVDTDTHNAAQRSQTSAKDDN